MSDRLPYNATVVALVPGTGGKISSVFVAHVDKEGYVLRSNAVQCTGKEDTRAYHEHLLLSGRRPFLHHRVVDGTEFYGWLTAGHLSDSWDMVERLYPDAVRYREVAPVTGAPPYSDDEAALAAEVRAEERVLEDGEAERRKVEGLS